MIREIEGLGYTRPLYHKFDSMDTEYIIYFYTRNGLKLCTPSIDLAFNRNDEGEVTKIIYGPE